MSQPSRNEIHIEDRKNKLEQYQDNRHNLNNLKEDKALDEIDFYIVKYIELENKFLKKSTNSKRLTTISLCTLIACICLIYSPILFGNNMLSELWRSSLNYMFTATLIIFIGNYFSNRMNGHTRAWSRNRLMLERLELIRREYEIAVHNATNDFISTEQDNTLTKLFELETQNRIETHKDIIGDYLAAHEGTFSWIKGLRK